ncbi:MAG TPA: OsmC family protein [Candidatus Kapabacteria bacterium]|nr:OsmC family protein [Candidatus Kapabacteria bacterium]
MNVVVALDKGVRSIGRNEHGHESVFDTSVKGGGFASAPSPVEHMLEAAGACMIMDIVPMLQKRKKNVIGMSVELTGSRREEHPRIFTSVHMNIRLTSPDVTKEELDMCIALSDEKYCTITNTLKLAGASVTYDSQINAEPGLSQAELASTPV